MPPVSVKPGQSASARIVSQPAPGLVYQGYNDWRLPTLCPINGTSLQNNVSNNATRDFGHARTTTDGTDGGWRDRDGNAVSEIGTYTTSTWWPDSAATTSTHFPIPSLGDNPEVGKTSVLFEFSVPSVPLW